MAQTRRKDQETSTFEDIEQNAQHDKAIDTIPIGNVPGGVLKQGWVSRYQVHWEHGPVESDDRKSTCTGQAPHAQIAHKKTSFGSQQAFITGQAVQSLPSIHPLLDARAFGQSRSGQWFPL
jgi:hypothetical protein